MIAALLTLPLLITSLYGGSSVNNPAWIEAIREGETLHVQGFFGTTWALSDELHYQLRVDKRGTSTMTTRQQGTFMPSPRGADTLSTVRVGVQPGDTVVARLDVTGASGRVASADFHDIIR
jgi:hypothetical protein